MVLIAVFLLPNVAASDDAAKEACEKGKACFDKRDYAGAVAAYSEAVRIDPKNAKAYASRGWTLACKENLDTALAEAFRPDPQLVATDSLLSPARVSDERYDSAIADFAEAVRINPKLADA